MSANAPDTVKVTIDGREVEVPKGTLLVEAAKMAGTEIPVFCYHPKLRPAGVCRMCLVEVEGQRKPLTACTTPVADGMVVKTGSPTVQSLQRGVLELLLLNHPLDCPICDKGGECDLQDLTYGWGPATSRLADPKLRRNKAVDLGPYIVFDEERCILCRRCVRFDDEIAQERTLVVEERAHMATIATPEGVPYDSYFGGNTIDLCPVGALTSRLYRFKARPWDLTRVPSICTGCSVGCNVELHFRHGTLMRVVPRENRAINDAWICDRGRFNYQYLYDERVERPLVRRGDRLVPVPWGEAIAEAARRLRHIVQEKGPKAVGFIGGGRLTNEEAYLFQKLARTVIQTPHIDHRVGAQTVASLGEFPGRIADIDRAQVILVVDALPAEVAPILDLRVRGAAARGARLVSIGAALPEYRVPAEALAVRPGETAQAVEGLAEALRSGEEEPTVPLLGERGSAVVHALRQASSVAVIWDGVSPAVGRALAALAGALGKETAVHLFVPGEQTNSRGAEA
ncbi:MAG TPA: 2Fe-2S iron-sulfur cluster-binding protein, partial [Limnochordia bacterium]